MTRNWTRPGTGKCAVIRHVLFQLFIIKNKLIFCISEQNSCSKLKVGLYSTPTIQYLYHNPTLPIPIPYPYTTLPYPIHQNTPHQTPPQHTTPHPTPPHHTTPLNITPHHTTLHHTTLHHTTPHGSRIIQPRIPPISVHPVNGTGFYVVHFGLLRSIRFLS